MTEIVANDNEDSVTVSENSLSEVEGDKDCKILTQENDPSVTEIKESSIELEKDKGESITNKNNIRKSRNKTNIPKKGCRSKNEKGRRKGISVSNLPRKKSKVSKSVDSSVTERNKRNKTKLKGNKDMMLEEVSNSLFQCILIVYSYAKYLMHLHK